MFWLYWAITIPLTITTMSAWALWMVYKDRSKYKPDNNNNSTSSNNKKKMMVMMKKKKKKKKADKVNEPNPNDIDQPNANSNSTDVTRSRGVEPDLECDRGPVAQSRRKGLWERMAKPI